MKTSVKIPWRMINEVMRDDYRLQMAEIALTYLPNASYALKEHAHQVLSKHVKIEGFRKYHWVGQAPVPKCLVPVANRMKQDGRVMSTIISLWAEAQSELIHELRTVAEKSDLTFLLDWTWQEGIDGFYHTDASPELEKLWEVAETMCHNRQQTEQDHIQLAAYWLSTAVTKLGSSDTSIDDNTPKKVDETESAQPPILLATDDANKMNSPVQEKEGNAITQEKDMPSSIRVNAIRESVNSAVNLHSYHLEKLDENLHVSYEAATETYHTVVDYTGELMQAVRASNLGRTETVYPQLGAAVAEWRQHRNVVYEILKNIEATLAVAFQERPELQNRNGMLLSLALDDQQEMDSAVQYARDMISQVHTYDIERQELLKELLIIQVSIAETIEEIQRWDNEIKVTRPEYYNPDSLAVAPKSEIQEIVTAIQRNLTENKKLLDKLDDENYRQVSKLLEEIRQSDFMHSSLPDGLDISNIDQFPIEIRKEFVSELSRIIQQIVNHHVGLLNQLCSELAVSWDDELLLSVLEQLATKKLAIEVLLLLLAANKEHPRSKMLSLSPVVVSSIVDAIVTFAQGQEPLLVNMLAPDLFSEWTYQDRSSKLNLYVLLIGASLIRVHSLPTGFLWTIEAEWPFYNMPTWSKLWKTIRDDTQVTIVDSEVQIHIETTLSDTRSCAETALHREQNDQFTRAKSLKDHKYRRVLNRHLLPHAETLLLRIETLKEQIQTHHSSQSAMSLRDLEQLINEIELAISDDRLQADFTAGLAAESIDNYHAFHSRTTLSNYREALEDVLSYAKALLNYGKNINNSAVQISSTSLREELADQPTGHSKALHWLDQILHSQDSEPQSYTSTSYRDWLEALEQELLNKAVYAQRLPRLIGTLTQRQFSWPVVLNSLLEDLANPSTSATISVDLLLTKDASYQAILLAEQISETQKQQVITRNNELFRQVEQLRLEYLKVSGEITEGLQRSIQLGRWQLVKELLRKQIDALRTKAKQQQLDEEEQILGLVEQLHSLEMDIFRRRSELSEEAFTNLQKSFTAVRQALHNGATDAVKEFIQGIQYRVVRNSWDAQDIKRQLIALNDAESRNDLAKRSSLNCQQLLEHLKNRELYQIGISAESFDDSKLDTRVEILEKWLYLQNNVSTFDGSMLDLDFCSKVIRKRNKCRYSTRL